MRPVWTAVRAGLARGTIELRQTFTNVQDLWNYFFPTVLLLTVMFFMKGVTVPGTNFSLGARTLPSGLGMVTAFGGLVTTAMLLVVEREDGTLLRAKAIPNGMVGYLVSKIVLVSGICLVNLSLLFIPGMFMLDGLAVDSLDGWLTLAWVVPLGLLATMPTGAILGSLLSQPRNIGLIMLPLMALIGTSGIFYPITALPGWVQAIAKVFPIYWLGLGMRSALLPDHLTVTELGGSWHQLQTVGVLGAWAIVGLTVAPVVLRRMARQESGSRVAARREKAIQRIA